MSDITEPVQVTVGKPVKASDHNTSADAITEITSVLETIENSQLLNGSFELDLSSWVATNITGGSNVIETSVVIHGAKSFKATATAGGGYVELDSDDFLNVSAGIDDVFIDGRVYPTAGVQIQGWIEWFDSSDVSISTQQFMDYTPSGGELNSWNRFRGWGRAVATARSYKVSFQLGDGTVAGSVYLDGLTSRINDPYPVVTLDANVAFYGSPSTGFHNVRVPTFGNAYTAGISIGDTGPGASVTYLYNADTGNFVDAAGIVSIVGGLLLDEGGEMQYDYHGTGTFTLYYSSWR